MLYFCKVEQDVLTNRYAERWSQHNGAADKRQYYCNQRRLRMISQSTFHL